MKTSLVSSYALHVTNNTWTRTFSQSETDWTDAYYYYYYYFSFLSSIQFRMKMREVNEKKKILHINNTTLSIICERKRRRKQQKTQYAYWIDSNRCVAWILNIEHWTFNIIPSGYSYWLMHLCVCVSTIVSVYKKEFFKTMNWKLMVLYATIAH